MIKDIVVNLGLGAHDHAGNFAVSIASAFGSHVLGVAFAYEPIIPGTKMIFPGIKNETEAGNLWAYLKQFGPDGKKK